jgi:poly-gamma-glutamate capsule biosynthesis protein CapA/YwtB (metallophosphatase superfamily)
MIHGGREYDRKPTTKISYLSAIARRAGASLVINHQPHVVGGFLWRDQALTAWTIGTFLADQSENSAGSSVGVYARGQSHQGMSTIGDRWLSPMG